MQEHRARPEASVPAPLTLEFEGGGSAPLRAIAKGQIDFANASFMQSDISAARQRLSSSALILDMSGVDFMDSSGLRVILHLDEQLRSEGGALVLLGASEAVRSIIFITGLQQHLTVADTLQAATDLAIASRGSRD